MPFESLDEIKRHLPIARRAFEIQVERVAGEVSVMAHQISGALGEVSIDELKDAIIKAFTERMKE